MELLAKYILESLNHNISMNELSPDDRSLLLQLDSDFNDMIMLCKETHNLMDIDNIDEEWEKFEKYHNAGVEYVPEIKYHNPIKTKENLVLDKLNNLRQRFMDFDCFLSKYYIGLIDEQIEYITHTENTLDGIYKPLFQPKASFELYQKALKLIKEYPYDGNVPDRSINGSDAADEIEEYIDKHGYPWKVILNKDMLPRMGVSADCRFLVNPERYFSKEDIESLKAHEVDGHVARRYYGLKTGLYLFQHGLPGRLILDEGLAIWKSLHETEHPKPNIMFNILFKFILTYHLNDMGFNELIDFGRKIAPNYDLRKIFKCVFRLKKDCINLHQLGGRNICSSYFAGLELVNNMDEQERDDILKYNIGPDQLGDLPMIKKFFELNRFEPIRINPN